MANEKRILANYLGGRIDSALTSGTTTLSSPALAAMPVVDSTNHMLVGLDPDGMAGEPEVVMVTAHTSAATTATIARAQEGTTARAHAAGVDWVHGAFATDLAAWPSHLIVNAVVAPVVGNASTFAYVDTRWGLERTITTPAQFATQGWDLPIRAGTWRLDIAQIKSNNQGIATITLGGVSVGTLDNYAAATATATPSFTGIVIPTGGLHRLLFAIDSKNASSSDYQWFTATLALTRTA